MSETAYVVAAPGSLVWPTDADTVNGVYMRRLPQVTPIVREANAPAAIAVVMAVEVANVDAPRGVVVV